LVGGDSGSSARDTKPVHQRLLQRLELRAYALALLLGDQARQLAGVGVVTTTKPHQERGSCGCCCCCFCVARPLLRRPQRREPRRALAQQPVRRAHAAHPVHHNQSKSL
jgi:hypothetical protein